MHLPADTQRNTTNHYPLLRRTRTIIDDYIYLCIRLPCPRGHHLYPIRRRPRGTKNTTLETELEEEDVPRGFWRFLSLSGYPSDHCPIVSFCYSRAPVAQICFLGKLF